MKKNKKSLPTSMILVIRIVLGVYLGYLSYEIVSNLDSESGPVAFFIAAAIVFVIFGIVIIIMSIKDLMAGRYVGGPMDIDEDETGADVDAENTEETVVDETVISEEQ